VALGRILEIKKGTALNLSSAFLIKGSFLLFLPGVERSHVPHILGSILGSVNIGVTPNCFMPDPKLPNITIWTFIICQILDEQFSKVKSRAVDGLSFG